jgi:hypothetical protein
MVDRLKAALVNSFVGAITLGWIFAQAILQCASLLILPLAQAIMARESPNFSVLGTPASIFSIEALLPGLIRVVFLLLVGYGLLRWLYYETESDMSLPPAPETELEPEAPYAP